MSNSISMMNTAMLRNFLLGGCNHLGANKDEVNSLNVFPVPDGDTGINMYLTVASAAKKIGDVPADLGVGKLATDFSMGALMGARGNSGVILSQIFRGLAVALAGKQQATTEEFAEALQKGVDLSYKSVMKPVEGTILTVYRHIAKAAVKAAAKGDDITAMLHKGLLAGEASLANTPNLLPVLKEAGVVDAGGKGLLYFFQGAAAALTEDSYITLAKPTSSAPAAMAEPLGAARDDISTANIEFTYCTQVLIKGENMPIDEIRERLSQSPPGDSLLVVGDETIIKIHFHTNFPGQVLDYCGKFGSLHDFIIDNMNDQHRETVIDFGDDAPANYQPEPAALPEAEPARSYSRRCGILAVCAGAGMAEIYQQLDADVISGGQTMNPSAEDLLLAVEKVDAEEVVILPNNSNIILTAQQVKQLTDRAVSIVPTKYVTQGLNALLSFSEMESAEDNAAAMQAAATEMVNGELTYAVRDTKFNGFDIKTDDLLALMQGEIVDCGQSMDEVLLALAEKMVATKDDPELITLYYGEDISIEEAERLQELLAEHFEELDIELFYGGQPLYYFLIAVD